MHTMRASLAVFVLFIYFAQFTVGHIDRIPNPNICKTSTSLRWESHDCPPNALCVPFRCQQNTTSHNRFCSCSYSDRMFNTNSDGRCGPSTGTYIYAGFWGLVGLFYLLISLHMLRSVGIAISTRSYTFKPDILNISCLFSFIAALLTFISRVILIMILVKFEFASLRVALVAIGSIVAAAILISTMTFGVAVQMIAVQSYKLQTVNLRILRRRVMLVALFVGLLIAVGGTVLFQLGQTAAGTLFFAIFAVVAYVLFNQIAKYKLRGTLPQNSKAATRITHVDPSVSASRSTSNDESRQLHFRIASSEKHFSISDEIDLLAHRCIRVFCMYVVLSVTYNILWYVGRELCSEDLLGMGVAVVNGLQYVMVGMGLAYDAIFFQRITKIRINHATSRDSPAVRC